MAKLTALSAKTLSKPGRHGDGLYLNIAPSGSKSWVQRIVVDGRRRDIGLGPYPAVSLTRAREIAHDNRSAIAQGRDPIAEFTDVYQIEHEFNEMLLRASEQSQTAAPKRLVEAEGSDG